MKQELTPTQFHSLYIIGYLLLITWHTGIEYIDSPICYEDCNKTSTISHAQPC